MRLDHLLSKEKVESKNVFYCLAIKLKDFWCRCGWGETPVPIPNTTVKTQSADGTALETVWESRWPPDQKKNNRRKSAEYKYRHWKVSPVGNRVEPEKNR